MNYLTFLYKILFQPEQAYLFLKENFNTKYFIYTFILIIMSLINYSIVIKGYDSFNSVLLYILSSIINILFIVFIYTILFHFFASLFDCEGKIIKLFGLIFFSYTPVILLCSLVFLSKYYEGFDINILQLILFIWSIILIYKSVKINYSLNWKKSIFIMVGSFVFIFSFIVLLIIFNTLSFISNLIS